MSKKKKKKNCREISLSSFFSIPGTINLRLFLCENSVIFFLFFFFKFQGATIPTRHSYFQVFSRSLLLLWRFLLGFDWDRVSFIVACVVIFFWLLIKRVLITHQRFSCSWALIVQSFCVIFSVSQTFLLASRLKDA